MCPYWPFIHAGFYGSYAPQIPSLDPLAGVAERVLRDGQLFTANEQAR